MSCGKTVTRRQAHAKKKAPVRKKAAKKTAKKVKYTAAQQAYYAYLKKKYPFKNDYAAWVKKHPFKNDYAAWIKAHPFKNRIARKVAAKHPVTHKVHCKVKTRSAGPITWKRGKPPPRIPNPRIKIRQRPATASRSVRSAKSSRALRAR